MADANNDLSARYYNGRPLNYDPHQAQVAPTPPPPPPPQPAVGEQANAPPAPPQPASPQDAGDQANHTQVLGVPGYYKGRVTKMNQSRAAAPPPALAAAPPPPPAPAAAPPPPAAVEPRKELSFIEKLGGENKK